MSTQLLFVFGILAFCLQIEQQKSGGGNEKREMLRANILEHLREVIQSPYISIRI